jgi:hypothetical protein
MNPSTVSRPLGVFAAAAGLLTVAVLMSHPASSLTVDGTQLANFLAGDGVLILSATVTLTNPKQAGTFAKPHRRNGIGLTSGVVLSSAWAVEENGTNDNQYLPGSDDLRGSGYDAFDSRLPPGFVSSDACVLRIEFKCYFHEPEVYFSFVYGTDDYPWTGTRRDNGDMMGAFMLSGPFFQDGVLLYRRELTINGTSYLAPFKDNMSRWYQTEMNGFTKPLTANLKSFYTRANVLYIAVADTGRMSGTLDGKNGAWLFLEAGSLKCDGRAPYIEDDEFGDDYDIDDDFMKADDDFNDDDDWLPLSPSAQPSASPYPFPTIKSTAAPFAPFAPQGSVDKYPTSWWTAEPTPGQKESPRSCALSISKACRCGKYSCYEDHLSDCKRDDIMYTPQMYRDRTFKVLKKVHCKKLA